MTAQTVTTMSAPTIAATVVGLQRERRARTNVSAAAEQQRRDGTAPAKARRKEHRGNAVAKQNRNCCSGADGFATEVALALVRLECSGVGLRLLSPRVVR